MTRPKPKKRRGGPSGVNQQPKRTFRDTADNLAAQDAAAAKAGLTWSEWLRRAALRALGLALLLGSAGCAPLEGLSADAVEGLECARVRAGYLDPQPAGCYRPAVLPGCVVVPPGDPCAGELDWYPGGEPFEVWCGVGRELDTDPVALRRVECAKVAP